MIIQCEWCKKPMGEKEPLDNKKISYGICDDCRKEIRQENEKYHLGRRMK